MRKRSKKHDTISTPSADSSASSVASTDLTEEVSAPLNSEASLFDEVAQTSEDAVNDSIEKEEVTTESVVSESSETEPAEEKPAETQTIEAESTEQAATPASTPTMSSGEMLKNMREQAAVGIEELATVLKVAPQQIQALEENDYAALPAIFVARGLASNICRHFNQDPHPVLAQMPSNTAVNKGARRTNLTASQPIIQTPIDITNRSGKAGKYILVTAVVLALLGLGVYGGWRLLSSRASEQTSSTAQANSTEAEATLSAPANNALAPALTPAPVATLSAAPASSTPMADASTAATSTAAPLTLQPAAPSAAPQSSANTLQINAVGGKPWVRVSSANGNKIFEGVIPAGQQRQITINQYPVHININKAEFAQIIDRGQPFSFSAAGVPEKGRALFTLEP